MQEDLHLQEMDIHVYRQIQRWMDVQTKGPSEGEDEDKIYRIRCRTKIEKLIYELTDIMKKRYNKR